MVTLSIGKKKFGCEVGWEDVGLWWTKKEDRAIDGGQAK